MTEELSIPSEDDATPGDMPTDTDLPVDPGRIYYSSPAVIPPSADEIPISAGQSTLWGIAAFANERARQVHEKQFDIAHDSQYEPHELVAAGYCYVQVALDELTNAESDSPPCHWPWQPKEWKPEETVLENLAKGGALVAAAYDRIFNQTISDSRIAPEVAKESPAAPVSETKGKKSNG